MVAEYEEPRFTSYLKTDRTNSTTKEREETTSEKVGSTEMWFRRETDPGCCRGEGVVVMEKAGERSTWECTKRTFPHRHWLGK